MSLFSGRRYHTMCFFYGLILTLCTVGISGCGQQGPLIEPGSEKSAQKAQSNTTPDNTASQ